jgi:hypothetical protein
MHDTRKIIKGKLYRWRSTQLLVLARTGERMDANPDSDFYKEYVFKGRIIASEDKEEVGKLDYFAASGGWRDA